VRIVTVTSEACTLQIISSTLRYHRVFQQGLCGCREHNAVGAAAAAPSQHDALPPADALDAALVTATTPAAAGCGYEALRHKQLDARIWVSKACVASCASGPPGEQFTTAHEHEPAAARHTMRIRCVCGSCCRIRIQQMSLQQPPPHEQ
jgi:hypothetical protein